MSAAQCATDLARAADQPSLAEDRVVLAGVSTTAAVAGQTQIHAGTIRLVPSRGRPLRIAQSDLLNSSGLRPGGSDVAYTRPVFVRAGTGSDTDTRPLELTRASRRSSRMRNPSTIARYIAGKATVGGFAAMPRGYTAPAPGTTRAKAHSAHTASVWSAEQPVELEEESARPERHAVAHVQPE
jgi:hypothetical protein